MYITKEDYFKFSGIDLAIELKGTATDNPSNVVDIFLNRVEEWCLDYLQYNYNLQIEKLDVVSFKKGVLHQIDYIRRNGDLSIDGANITRVLAPNAFMVFRNAGMCNIVTPKFWEK